MALTGRHVHVDPSDLEPEAEVQTSNKSRIIWTFADQALSSLANFALSIVVAREVSEDDFGSFSLMLVTFTFLIGLGRAGIGDPYVIRFTDATGTPGVGPSARPPARRSASAWSPA